MEHSSGEGGSVTILTSEGRFRGIADDLWGVAVYRVRTQER